MEADNTNNAEKMLHISCATAKGEQQAVRSRLVDEIPNYWRTQQQQERQQQKIPKTPPVRQRKTEQAQPKQKTDNKHGKGIVLGCIIGFVMIVMASYFSC